MNNIAKVLVALAATMIITAPVNAVVHTAKRVVDLHQDSTRPCAIFRLEGVDQADPVLPGAPWFVLPRSHSAFTELFAMLLTAKATNLPVNIHTRGTRTNECEGFATVEIVMIN